MADIYVHPVSGSDTAPNDGSQALPFRTIAKATAVMAAGDVVNLSQSAVYDEEAQLVAGVSPSQRSRLITKSGWGTGTTKAKVAPTSANKAAFRAPDGCNYVSVEDVELTNTASTLNSCVFVGSASYVRLLRCYVHDSPRATDENAVSFNGTGVGCDVLECEVSYGAGDCINFHVAHTGYLVARNHIHHAGDGDYSGGAPGDGGSQHNICSGVYEDNFIHDCTKGGLIHVHTAGLVTCRRNFVRDCARYGIVTLGTGDSLTYRNIVVIPDTNIYAFGIAQALGGTGSAYFNTVVNLSAQAFSFGSNDNSVAVTWSMAGNVSLLLQPGTQSMHHMVAAIAGGTHPWTLAIDQNRYYPDSGALFYWNDGAPHQGTLAAFYAATGADKHSAVGDPLFRQPPVLAGLYPANPSLIVAADLRLAAASPARGFVGTAIAGVPDTLDFYQRDVAPAGLPYDAGAAKFVASRRRRYFALGAL